MSSQQLGTVCSAKTWQCEIDKQREACEHNDLERCPQDHKPFDFTMSPQEQVILLTITNGLSHGLKGIVETAQHLGKISASREESLFVV